MSIRYFCERIALIDSILATSYSHIPSMALVGQVAWQLATVYEGCLLGLNASDVALRLPYRCAAGNFGLATGGRFRRLIQARRRWGNSVHDYREEIHAYVETCRQAISGAGTMKLTCATDASRCGGRGVTLGVVAAPDNTLVMLWPQVKP